MKPLLLVNIFFGFFLLLLYPYRANTFAFFNSRSACSDIFISLITSFAVHIAYIYPLLGYQHQYYADFDFAFATLAFILQP